MVSFMPPSTGYSAPSLAASGTKCVPRSRKHVQQVDPFFMKPAVQILKGQGDIKEVRVAIRFPLFRRARTDEDDADVIAVDLAEKPAVGKKW